MRTRFGLWAWGAALAAVCAGCGAPPAAPVTSVVVVRAKAAPTDPQDAAWRGVPEFHAPLVLQDLVEPRQMQATTAEVRVKAIAGERDVAFRLEWDDPTENNVSDPGNFCDACAVQLPRSVGASVPSPQMGEPGREVEITYWNAGWQAIVDGRGDAITDLYPHATVDHYPFQAKPLESDPAAQKEMTQRYAPARALGNAMAGPRTSPVQDLVAAGPGTLSPAPATISQGKGQRTAGGWAVVITRPLPEGLRATPNPQMAFAVWEGGQQEVGARKMRTGWLAMAFKETP